MDQMWYTQKALGLLTPRLYTHHGVASRVNWEVISLTWAFGGHVCVWVFVELSINIDKDLFIGLFILNVLVQIFVKDSKN